MRWKSRSDSMNNSVPRPVHAQVPVEEFRTRLWEEALVEVAHRRDWPLAERLQRCFTQTRLDRFWLEPGVKVGAELVPGCGHA